MADAALLAALAAADASGVSGLNVSQKDTVKTQMLLDGAGGGGGGGATEATLATRASEATVATLATQATLATRASETTAASIAANTLIAGYTALITPTVTVSTSPAYTAGDAVGGKLTLTNAVRASGTGILESIMVLDRSNQKPALEILIFDADPTAATITDNAAFVFSTDDLKVLARVPVAAADFVTLNGKATAIIKVIGAVLKAASGTSLYAAIVTTGTPTFVATTDVQVRFGILQD